MEILALRAATQTDQAQFPLSHRRHLQIYLRRAIMRLVLPHQLNPLAPTQHRVLQMAQLLPLTLRHRHSIQSVEIFTVGIPAEIRIKFRHFEFLYNAGGAMAPVATIGR